MVAFTLADLPDSVLHEAKRALFNVLAVAIGASRHPGFDTILRVARETGGAAVAPVVGRSVRADAHFGALANGFSAHVHPAAAVAANKAADLAALIAAVTA